MGVIIPAMMIAASYGIVSLIYGREGLRLRERQGKKIFLPCAGVAIALIFWALCLMLWVKGLAANDRVLCIVVTFLVPAVLVAIGFKTRKSVREQLAQEREAETDNPQSMMQTAAEAGERLAQERMAAADTARPKTQTAEEKIDYNERERTERRAFIAQMGGFLEAHGSKKTDVEGLLDYAREKTGVGFNFGNVTWTAQTDCIRCRSEWAGCSFFDDGGSIEGYFDWSITFAGTSGEHPVENEKLKDRRTFRVPGGEPKVPDTFYCEDPFGLKGIFVIHYEGEEAFLD